MMLRDLSIMFWCAAVVGVATFLHVTVRTNWPSIRAALLGKLGRND